MHARTHTHTQARTHARTHTHTHTQERKGRFTLVVDDPSGLSRVEPDPALRPGAAPARLGCAHAQWRGPP